MRTFAMCLALTSALGCATSGAKLTKDESRCSVVVTEPAGMTFELRIDEEQRAFYSGANWRHVATLEGSSVISEARGRPTIGHVDGTRLAYTKGTMREWIFEPTKGAAARVRRRGLADAAFRASEMCSQRQLALGAIVLLDIVAMVERQKKP